jgi:hypothetical protein
MCSVDCDRRTEHEWMIACMGPVDEGDLYELDGPAE